MRKLYFLLLSVLLCGSIYAQRAELTTPKGEATRNGWIGNKDWAIDGANSNIYEWPAGQEIAFSPLYYQMFFQNSLCAVGTKIEKVRFAFAPDESRPNRDFVLKIYNNIDASGQQAYSAYGNYVTLPANACGTPVYTQNITCTELVGWQTFTLDTPFTITGSSAYPNVPVEFWISLTPAGDSYIVGGDWVGYSGSEIYIGEEPVDILGIFFEYSEATLDGDEDLWLEYVGCTTDCSDENLHIQPLAIGCYYNDGGALNLECEPLAIWTNAQGELSTEGVLPPGGTLSANVSMINVGPDVIPAGQNISIGFYIDGQYTGFTDSFTLTEALTLENQFVNCTQVTFEPADFNYEAGVHEVEARVLYSGQTYVSEPGSIFYVYYNYDGIATDITSKVSVYPNPVATNLTISNAKDAKLTIMNNLGQTVATIENAENEQTVDVSNLSNGVYFVRIEKDADFSVVKFTVSK